MSIEISPITRMGIEARKASHALANFTTKEKNELLYALADELEANAAAIIAANEADLANARKAGMSQSLIDRLLLDGPGLAGVASDVRSVASLRDPVGEILGGGDMDCGISLIRRRVPLGVVAAIYEARPNVTVDVASLCLKTGNAAILRGGKETVHTNAILVDIIQSVLKKHNLPSATVQAITDPDRSLVDELLRLDEYVDMLIPRGSAPLQRHCREHSRIPLITGGIGVCHIIIDETANQEASLTVIENAKVQRPSACNAVETLLVHKAIAKEFLPKLDKKCKQVGITLHAGEKAAKLFSELGLKIAPVQPGDYDKEWLSLDCNVEIVDNLDEAIAHIREHGTGHSDGILTEDMVMADIFVRQVDSSSVYINASTRFTDGGQFGLGAEVAISTQKLHARGPLGLEALTTYKWIAQGKYTVRK